MKYVASEEYGLWTIFLTYGSLIMLIDFGFANNFTRSVTYVFSGAKELSKEGYIEIGEDNRIDYGLLKGVINAMKYYYSIVSFIAIIFFGVVGTIHLYIVMQKGYHGNSQYIYLAWIGYICIICYQLYTLYYESLIMGRGFVKKQMQITIISQIVYMIIVCFFIINGFGIGSMVLGLVFSVTVNRYLSKYSFFDKQINQHLLLAEAFDRKILIKTLSHNSIRIGLTTLGGFCVARASILVGSIYLPLSLIAAFGLSKQLVDVVGGISCIANSTYYPRMTFLRINGDLSGVKKLYLKNWLFFVVMFFLGSIMLITFGNWILIRMKSNTLLLSSSLLYLMLIITFLENNHGWAGYLLLIENKVPFFKASLICGSLTVCLLFIFLEYLHWDVLSLILAPGIAQLYQNWKWPYEVIKAYSIKTRDFVAVFKKST